jgi:hypothetical protein
MREILAGEVLDPGTEEVEERVIVICIGQQDFPVG